MSKITSEHLGRGAYVYIRQSTATNSCTTMRVAFANMASPIALVRSAGPRSR